MKSEFEFDKDLQVAFENFDEEKLAQLPTVLRTIEKIEKLGICREDYDIIENFAPGTLKDINPKRLTIARSNNGRDIALEAFDASFIRRFGVATAAGVGGFGYLLYKFVSWIRSKLTGNSDFYDIIEGNKSFNEVEANERIINERIKTLTHPKNGFADKLLAPIRYSDEKMKRDFDRMVRKDLDGRSVSTILVVETVMENIRRDKTITQEQADIAYRSWWQFGMRDTSRIGVNLLSRNGVSGALLLLNDKRFTKGSIDDLKNLSRRVGEAIISLDDVVAGKDVARSLKRAEDAIDAASRISKKIVPDIPSDEMESIRVRNQTRYSFWASSGADFARYHDFPVAEFKQIQVSSIITMAAQQHATCKDALTIIRHASQKAKFDRGNGEEVLSNDAQMAQRYRAALKELGALTKECMGYIQLWVRISDELMKITRYASTRATQAAKKAGD